MSEVPEDDSLRQATHRLAESLGGFIGEHIKLREFMARKVAHEALVEYEFTFLDDEEATAALEELLSVPVISGIILSGKKTTTPDILEAEVARLQAMTPEPLHKLGDFLYLRMIQRGIQFHLDGVTSKREQWFEEYQTLRQIVED